MIKVWGPDEARIINLAKTGKSASQIVEQLGLPIGRRQVQRIVRAAGLGRHAVYLRNCPHCGKALN
jgi:hypothetical protein